MRRWVLVWVVTVVGGCTGMLPAGRQETVTPWHSFEDAKEAYEKIIPYKTTRAELHELGYDPTQTANVTILNFSQVVKTVIPRTSYVLDDLPQGMRDCVRAEEKCFGYQLEQSQIKRKRVGNFFLDFLNFDRETLITGWRFGALVVLVDGTVVYKQWSGQPMVRQVERNRNPLGPLQGAGDKVVPSPF